MQKSHLLNQLCDIDCSSVNKNNDEASKVKIIVKMVILEQTKQISMNLE